MDTISPFFLKVADAAFSSAQTLRNLYSCELCWVSRVHPTYDHQSPRRSRSAIRFSPVTFTTGSSSSINFASTPRPLGSGWLMSSTRGRIPFITHRPCSLLPSLSSFLVLGHFVTYRFCSTRYTILWIMVLIAALFSSSPLMDRLMSRSLCSFTTYDRSPSFPFTWTVKFPNPASGMRDGFLMYTQFPAGITLEETSSLLHDGSLSCSCRVMCRVTICITCSHLGSVSFSPRAPAPVCPLPLPLPPFPLPFPFPSAGLKLTDTCLTNFPVVFMGKWGETMLRDTVLSGVDWLYSSSDRSTCSSASPRPRFFPPFFTPFPFPFPPKSPFPFPPPFLSSRSRSRSRSYPRSRSRSRSYPRSYPRSWSYPRSRSYPPPPPDLPPSPPPPPP
eukprot:Sspe_Gene.34909::Locus_16951_Transcript_1_1_Confidence_1.000_Length_2915::g.34909::m.34909